MYLFIRMVIQPCNCPEEILHRGGNEGSCACEGGVFDCKYKCPGGCYSFGEVVTCEEAGYSDEGTSSNPADEVTAGAPPSGPAPATVTCPGKSKACDCVQAPGSDCGQEFCECSEARGAGCCNDAR